jgi:hypothetical protein
MHRGFACGSNIVVPPNLTSCLTPEDAAPDQWRFIDSSACTTISGSNKFYMVIYQQPCTAAYTECAFTANWGFIEAVDNPSLAFADFRRAVITANPASLTSSLADPSKRTGTYVSTSGERIAFDISAGDDAVVKSVNGVSEKSANDWDFAEGDVIKADGNGKMEIHNPNFSDWIEIDLSSKDHPKRTPH